MTESHSSQQNEVELSGTVGQPQPVADPEGGRYNLRSVTRALRLLNALATAGEEGLSLTEASRQVEASKSATFSLLKTLLEYDYATSFDRGPRYRLGPAIVHLADGYSESLPWLRTALPIARELTASTGWTSRIATHIDGHPVFQERVDAPGVLRFFTQLGIKELPHRSSAGKAILSQLPEAEVRRIVGATGLPARTPNTITDVEVLLRELRRSTTRGYAVDDEEDDEGIFCIASPVCDRNGAPIGAISITGLKSTMPAWRVAEFGSRVLAAANQISVAIGGRPLLATTTGPTEGPPA